jgi:hypothetical protein
LAHTVDPHPTTCRLRAAALMPAQPALPHLAKGLDRALVQCGLDDLGAGVYQRGDERWLATYLPADVLLEVFVAAPLGLPDESIAIALRPDVELGATAICITAADAAYASRLDEVALWAIGACAVEELLRGLGDEMSHQ